MRAPCREKPKNEGSRPRKIGDSPACVKLHALNIVAASGKLRNAGAVRARRSTELKISAGAVALDAASRQDNWHNSAPSSGITRKRRQDHNDQNRCSRSSLDQTFRPGYTIRVFHYKSAENRSLTSFSLPYHAARARRAYPAL